MSPTEAWTAKVEAGVMGAWWGRAAEQLNLPGAQSRAWETELPGWTSNAFNKYFLNQVSATIRQALLDTETAKVNERLKPGSTQVRGRAEPTSTTAKCRRVWTRGSAVSSGLCLSSSAPLCWLHFQALSHLPGKREALVSTGSGRRVPGEDTARPGLAPMLSAEPITEAVGVKYLVTWPGPHVRL